MKNHVLNCPICGEKLDEIEGLEEGKVIRKKCPNCKAFSWFLVEIELRALVDYKEVKKEK
jgi:phage FluMu protein Com